MIFPLKRNFRDKIFESFLRGVLEGLKISRLKFSRSDKNLRNPRKFPPSKILGYTVLQAHELMRKLNFFSDAYFLDMKKITQHFKHKFIGVICIGVVCEWQEAGTLKK